MGEAFLVLVSAVLIYCTIGFVAVTWDEYDAGRTCAEQHNVYTCEKVETWVPVKP